MKKYLTDKVFEYKDVIAIISEHLAQVDNLQEFCKQHNIQYNTLLLLRRNYKDKRYPRLVVKLLGIFGYKVDVFTAFKFLDLNKYTYPVDKNENPRFPQGS